MIETKLNPSQHDAATHDAGPLLIVAGAGTGKTTVITERIAWLVAQGKAETNQILALTFTEKAAQEMEERVDRLLPYGFLDLWISTFHAFAQRLLQAHGVEIGLPTTFRVLSTTEQWLLVRKNLDRFSLEHYKPLGNPTKFIHALLKVISRAKDEMITPQQYFDYAEELRLNADAPDFIARFTDGDATDVLDADQLKEFSAQEVKKAQEVADAYHVYQQLLAAEGALDFGDLIVSVLRLLQERPALLAKYRQQFKYILVDEFQDTNYAQYELVKLLAAPHNNITVVGDDDQSVYKFRGASVSNILEFKKHYPHAREIFLTHNYRSAQSILDLSYAFIQQNNPDRLEVKLAEAGSALSKKLIAHTPRLDSPSSARRAEPGVIAHLHYATQDDEVAGVLATIMAHKEAHPETSWNDFAILCRTNDVSNVFVHALSQTQIPFQFVASRGLYLKPIVLDIIAYLRLLDNYHESSATYRVLSSSVVNLDIQHVIGISIWAKRKGYSLFEALRHPEALAELPADEQAKIQQLLTWVERHSRLAQHQSVGKVVLAFLEDTGYVRQFDTIESTEQLQASTYLNQLYKKMTEFEKAVDQPTVKYFLELVSLELESGDEGTLEASFNEGPEAVKVMTVHAAKGLEFGHVFIVSMVDRRFPVDDRSDPIVLPAALVKEILPSGDAHLQEERRLLYVAMTRAKRHLYFTTALDYGGSRKKKVSRFMTELSTLGLTLTNDPQVLSAKISAGSEPAADQLTVRDHIAALLPTQFYFSQLKEFEKCPYHYWLKYVVALPQPGTPALSFGGSIHNVLQKFFELVNARAEVSQGSLFDASVTLRHSKGDAVLREPQHDKPESTEKKSLVNLDELLALYDQHWIDDWYPSRKLHDEYRVEGKKILKQFYDSYCKELPRPQLLEQKFKLQLHSGEEVFTITGKIDRVDAVPGGMEIIDYKTGKGKTKDSFSTDDKQQLLMYQLAAADLLKEPVTQLTYYYLTTGEKISFVGSEKDLEKLRQKIVDTINEIRSTPFPLTPADCTCRQIDLRTL